MNTMYLIYIDDSSEPPTHIFSALAVPYNRWNENFERVKTASILEIFTAYQ